MPLDRALGDQPIPSSALSEASKDRTPEWRGTANGPGSFTAPA